MNLAKTFSDLKNKNEPALILYYPAGYPDMDTSMENIKLLAEQGADIIEVGIPFSDPLADGPVIQYASSTALANGATVAGVLARLPDLHISKPLVLMSYLNPLESFGKACLGAAAAAAGIRGVIIPDCPVEHARSWESALEEYNIEMIYLTAPNSSEERLQMIAARSRGFIYAVSLTGVTGTTGSIPANRTVVSKLRGLTDTPIALGFGISTPCQIQEAGRIADGVIVGSRLIDAVSEGEDLADLVASFKQAAVISRRCS